ncbi:MAG: flagellar basal body P-ring protein FlgI [Pseudomonadales bacterium]|uniref:flagellar basal body P-ring protein FlgI n=1 Tax=Marinobacter xestospongiae TaxID=994319 RepID=UPI002004B60D|nr:flagellar basal body P-ring protein FlgI [Marinobacter xestospongiae]MCG8519723.1 flagellar basal body P-ring protein FlgI [Pseudomonadales bacterium]MCK7565796.1 flagellar basal body P-ring protein FlgI [Marinobacter xestospongiae]
MNRLRSTALLLVLALVAAPVLADRLKDLARIKGVRNNQLVGYGLVVGLDGTGDKAPFTNQTFRNMMNQFGVTLPEGTNPNLANVAAVTVHATLPPFAKPGQEMDVTVSSIGNADSLRGGSLLMTSLKGADGQVYAMAQGSLVVGGFGAAGADGSRITVNVPSVGRIPNGATIEREVLSPFSRGDTITFNLLQPDFTTARRVVETVNGMLGPDMAYAHDATSISVKAPRDPSQRVSFLSILENLEVDPAEDAAKVVINSRTGTIVVGQNVRVSPAAITHGNLTVTIQENPEVNQPDPFANGDTVVTPNTQIAVTEDPARMFQFGPATTLNEIVQAVNQVGAAPGDVMAVLEALKQAGALRAELIVI